MSLLLYFLGGFILPDYFVMLILITGIIAGFFNTVGGGGSLITMPMLIFLGMPSAMANGTNRIALIVQNLVAVASFKTKYIYLILLMLAYGF